MHATVARQLFLLLVATVVSCCLCQDDNNNKLEDHFVWSQKYKTWLLDLKHQNLNSDQEFNSEKFNKSDIQNVTMQIWPHDQKTTRRRHEVATDQQDDRIVAQLNLPRIVSNSKDGTIKKVFKIVPPDFGYELGSKLFVNENCRAQNCEISYNHRDADAIIWPNADVSNELIDELKERRSKQIWIAYFLESPINTFSNKLLMSKFKRKRDLDLEANRVQFNWTATYRPDSDIVTPYAKFVPYAHTVHNYFSIEDPRTNKQLDWQTLYENEISDELKAIIARKKSKAAMFVSNCASYNERLEFARKLSQFVQVDIYGKCGDLRCDKQQDETCMRKLREEYKFYLAFENSNCRHYITEKLFKNGLNFGKSLMLPIVMGANLEDYKLAAPRASFVHVDEFESPEALGKYLKDLGESDARFYAYLRWRSMGTFVNTKFMCRVCNLLNLNNATFTDTNTTRYSNLSAWWINYPPADKESDAACKL